MQFLLIYQWLLYRIYVNDSKIHNEKVNEQENQQVAQKNGQRGDLQRQVRPPRKPPSFV